MMGKIFLALAFLSLPALAAPNNLARDAEGFYTFERSPVSGGWLAPIQSGADIRQFSASYETEDLYNLFKALGANGTSILRCREARGIWLTGYYVAHLYSVSDCQF